MSEGVIREVLKQFNGIDYAFLGIGTLEDPIISRFLQPEEIENLRELGAVGQICLRYFDNQGQFLTGALNKRVISVSVEQLSQMKNVVALAGGSDKFDAVLGILKSGLLDVLVTDEETARFVLEN
jgi:DNA-binding transcriptional regulator LsrR (DeoR family)